MAYGIGSVIGDIDQKVDTYRNNPEALMQMYQQNQQLVDLLALQKLKTEKEAAMRDMQLKAQTPAATIKDQREQEVMGMMRNEVAQQLAPGLQAMGQQAQAQAQPEPQGGGISSLPAPNMQEVGMAGGGIVAFAEGGDIVGYDGAGNPITQEQYDQMLAALEQAGESKAPKSGYDVRQAQKAAKRERAGPEMQEAMGEGQGKWDAAKSFVAEHPVDTALTVAAIPALVAAAPEAAGLAGLRALGPRAMNVVRSLYSKPNPAFWEKISAKGVRSYPAGVSERLFSPGRNLSSVAGLDSLSHMLDFGSGDAEDAAAKLTATVNPEDIKRSQPTSTSTAAPATAGNSTSTAAPQRRAAPTVDEQAAYTRSLQRGVPEAGIASALPEKQKEALMAVPTEAVKQAPPEVQNEYTRRLSELRQEEESKLDTLIAFLKGAGGKTTFAATMAGGADALNARDERIKAEIMATADKIEGLKLKEREMGISEEKNAIAREGNVIQERLGRAQVDAQRYNADLDFQAAMAQVDANNYNNLMDYRVAMAEKAASSAKALNDAVQSQQLTTAQRNELLTYFDETMAETVRAQLTEQVQARKGAEKLNSEEAKRTIEDGVTAARNAYLLNRIGEVARSYGSDPLFAAADEILGS